MGPRLPGCRFLDLYAGSGAVGLEALSRGAAGVVFVEQHRPAAALVRENVKALQFPGRAAVHQEDAYAFLRRARPPADAFDIVFLDPPYAGGDVTPALEMIGAGDLLSARGVVVVESARGTPPPESAGDLQLVKRRHYGDTTLSFYEISAGGVRAPREAVEE